MHRKYIKILLKPIKKYGLATVLVFSLLLSPSSYLILAQEATQSAETESTRQSGETAPSVVPTPTDPPAGGLTLPPTPTPTSTLSPTPTPKVETTPIAAPSATLKPTFDKPSLDKVKLLKESFKAGEDVRVALGGLKLGDIKPILIGPDGERLEVEVEEEIVDSETILKIKRPRSFVPGKYTLTVEDEVGNSVEQDFTWGVLAINTNKSIYLSSEALATDSAKLSTQAAELVKSLEDQVRDISEHLATISAEIEEVKEESAEIGKKVKEIVGETQLSVSEEKEVIKNSEVMPGVDIQYQAGEEELRESIILKSQEELKDLFSEDSQLKLNFNLKLKDLVPHRDEEGDWRFRAKENNSDVFTFLKPIFKDAAGTTISAELNLANPQGAKLDSTEFAVTLVASRKWLESKDRVYPITIEHPIRANRENIDYDPKTTLQRPLPIDTSIKKTLGEELFFAKDYDWQVKLPASFGGGYYLFGQKNKEGGVKIIGPEGWSLSFRQEESQAKDFNLVGNQIKWQSGPGIISRYTSLSDRLKADYLVEKREALFGEDNDKLSFTVKFNDEPKDEADELTIFKGKGYLRPEQNSDGTISFVAENDGEIFKLPLPEITDAKGQKTIGSFTFQKIGQGIATLSVNIPDKFLDSAIFPLTIDPTVLNSAADVNTLLYAGGEHIVRTANGKLVACYVKDPTNDYPACRVSSDNGATWGTEQVITSYDAQNLAIGADQTDGNVFYLVFLDYIGLKAVSQGNVLFYKGVLSGTDIAFSGPLTLDGSTKARQVTLTVDTQNNRPAVAWSIEKRSNPSPRSLVRFLRCKTGDCLTDSHWTNAAGTSDCTGNLPTAYLTDACADAMAATTATNVAYPVTIDQMPGSGTFADPASVKWDDNGSFSTLTNAFDNDTGTTSSINSLSATQDYLYVGYSSTFGKVHLDITDTNANAATLNAQYYNGAWTSLGSVRDGTESPSGTAFGTDGAVGVGVSDTETGIPSDWTTTTVDSVSAYWVRFRPSADFDASVSLAEVDIATTYAKDLFLWWFHSVDKDVYYNSAAWDGTDDWNWLETTVEDADASGNTYAPFLLSSTRDETNSKLIFGYQAETGTDDDFEVYERNTANTKTARTTAGGLGSSDLPSLAVFAEDNGNIYAIYRDEELYYQQLQLKKNTGGTSWTSMAIDAGGEPNSFQLKYNGAGGKLDMLYRTGTNPYAVEYHTWHLTETRAVSAETSLPTDDSISLTGANDYFFDEDDYVDTNTSDNNYDSWDQSANTGRGTSDVGATDYAVYYFKDTNTNNTDNITPAWEGKFSQACGETYPVKLEIYCRSASCSGGAGWKEVASSTICTADTDFSLSGTISTDVSYYYGTDDWIGSNAVALRVYKQSNGAAVSAYTDYFSQNAALFTAPSGVDISGTCDQYDQTTDCVDDGTEEIKVAVNNTLQAQVDTDFTGLWSITGVTVNSGDTVTVFINNATSGDQAVAVTEYDGSGAITGMKLFERHLTIGSDDTGVSITNTELDKYTRASHGDDDVFHEVTTGTLTVDASGIFTDEELFILTGSTFAPAGDVNTHDIELETTAGVFTLGSNTIKVSGSWDNNSTFNAGSSTVTFNSTSTGETIEAGASSFYDVVFNSSTGGWTIQTDNLTTNNLTITDTAASGFTVSGVTIEVQGTYSIADAETANTTWTSATLYLNSGTSYTVGSKNQTAETYSTLQVGANTDIRMWNSSASTYTVDSSGSLYSQDHGGVNGDLYIWGDWHTQTNEYWSYATDFDGTDLTGSERQVDVRIDPGAIVTVDSGDALAAIGSTSPNRTTVGRQGASNGYQMVVAGGTINFQYTDFDYLDGNKGIDIQASSTVSSLDNTKFDNLIGTAGTDDAFITVASSVIGSATKTITGVQFDNTGSGAEFNVNRTGSDDTGKWDFESSTGTFDGEVYDGKDGTDEADPGMLYWDDSNTAPTNPSSLAQKKTDDTVLNVGDWTNETSVKFTATASDPDSSDTLYLCVEKDTLGTGFSDSEDSCGTGVAYSGTPVEVTVTISSLADDSEYHWQARVKDAAAAYSGWVSYDVNLETERDFGIDSTVPTGGTVYDGTEIGVDKDFNDGSLSSLSANWSGFDASVSGLSSYEYSIGTSQGGIDVKVWTDNGTVTSVTASILTLQTSQVYYFNVRAIDNAGGTQSPVISSDGQIITPSLSFSLSPTTISFVNLNEGNSYNDTKTSTLTTSTNAYGGYVVRAFATDYLRSADSSFTIINFNGGTYASPDEWLTGDRGFGYNSSDTLVQGSNKFNSTPCSGGGNPPCYASFSQTAPGDILADHTNNVTGSPITNEQFTMTYQVKTNNIQAASTYVTTVVYTITAIY